MSIRSRLQFWDRKGRPGIGVIVATAYIEEAARFDLLLAMDDGRLLAIGTPAELLRPTGADNFDVAFIALLPEAQRRVHKQVVIPPRTSAKVPEPTVDPITSAMSALRERV